MFSSPGKAAAETQAGTPTNYLDLYGLSKSPFGEPDSDDGYILFNSHKRTFELLVGHFVNGHGLIVLGGAEGAGKSRMLAAAGNLAGESGLRIVKLPAPALGLIDAPRLAAAIQAAANSEGADVTDLEAAIRSFLEPPRAVLVIDDIDRLTADGVAALITIVQRSTDGPGVVVATTGNLRNNPGHLELARLARAELSVTHLGPAEVRQYIERSLWIAGGTTRRLIAPDALRLIVARSNGLPGSINRLMETIFTTGFARGESLVTAKTVAATLAPSEGRKRTRQPGRAGTVVQAVAASLLVAGTVAFLYRGFSDVSVPARRPTSPQQLPPPKVERRPVERPKVEQRAELPATPVTPAQIPSPELIGALIKRGEQSLGLGDIAAARLLFQRAAEVGSAAAATALGKTYDPTFQADGADPARAADCYLRAISLGDQQAADLLKRLVARPSGPKR